MKNRSTQYGRLLKSTLMSLLILAGSGVMAGDDWGPFTGPWERYDDNPLLPKSEEDVNMGMCPAPDGLIEHDGKLWMFIYNQDGANTKLAVSENGLEWEYVHEKPILEAQETMYWTKPARS